MHRTFNVILATFVVVVLSLASSIARAQETFKVDPVHSGVLFKINHLGVSNVWGRFNDPQGTIVWDDADPAKGRIEITLQAEKVDTGNPKRDAHLRSPDFFNARQFPTLSFKSKQITRKSDNEFEVAGDMTVHGVTKPITVTVHKVGQGDTRMGHRAGWETTFMVKRSDYGITFMPEALGDEVTLVVSIEGIRG